MAKTLTANQRKKIVDDLITNCGGCGWVEEDREILNELPDEKLITMDDCRKTMATNAAVVAELVKRNPKAKPAELVKLVANAFPPSKDDEDEDDEEVEKEEEDEEVENKKKPAANSRKPKEKVVTVNALTAEQKEDIAFARSIKQERKDAAIAVITANSRNPFSAEELQAMSLNQLQQLATLAEEPKRPNYAGVAGVQNIRADEQDILPLPTSLVG
jgi:hypothetical protein